MPDEKRFANDSFKPFVQHVYAHLRHGYEKSNLFFSPLSIYSSLSLALCGASGETHHAIAHALCVRSEHFADYEATLRHLGKELDGITAEDDLHTLVQANGIFIDAGFEVNRFFKEYIHKYFHGKQQRLDFSSNSEDARQCINQWVGEHTASKIKELMSSGSIDRDTKIVLANAIYFKGTWMDVFSRECTHDAPFYTLSGDKIQVPMMTKNGVFKTAHFSDLKVTCVKIPFKRYEMLLTVPDEKAGLPELLAHLLDEHHYKNFKEIFDPSRYTEDRIELYLPKFKLGTNSKSLDLKKPLALMGLAHMFDPHKAGFERITTTTKLHVTTMVHKAMIEVNEEGAEASAATGMAVTAMSLAPSIVADHPFLFFIVTDSGFPLFAGHVTNPLEE